LDHAGNWVVAHSVSSNYREVSSASHYY
jgi:hypothetical protein